MVVEIILGMITIPILIAFVIRADSLVDAVGLFLWLALSVAFYYRWIKNFRRVHGNKDLPNQALHGTAGGRADASPESS